MRNPRNASHGLWVGLVALLGGACAEAPIPASPSPTPESPAFSLHVASWTDIVSYVGRCSTTTLEAAPAPEAFAGTGRLLALPSRRWLYAERQPPAYPSRLELHPFRIDPQVGSLSPLSAPGLPLTLSEGTVLGADPSSEFFFLGYGVWVAYGATAPSRARCTVGRVLDSGAMGPASAPSALPELLPPPPPSTFSCVWHVSRSIEQMVGHPEGKFVYVVQRDSLVQSCYPKYTFQTIEETAAVWTLELDRNSGVLTPIREGPVLIPHADSLTLDPLGRQAFLDTGSETTIYRIDAASGALVATGHAIARSAGQVIAVHSGGRFVYSSGFPHRRFYVSRVEPDGSVSTDSGQDLYPEKYSSDLHSVNFVAFRVHPSGRFAHLLTAVEGGKAVPNLLLVTALAINSSTGRLSELSRQEFVHAKWPVGATFVIAPGACP
jgi:hypothetical protein